MCRTVHTDRSARTAPDLDGPIRARGDHLARVRRVVLRPQHDLVVHGRRWVWRHRLALCCASSASSSPVPAREELTLSKSHAHTRPSSSPHTTLASAWPNTARQRYSAFLWPAKSASSLPVAASMRRACPSSVVARYVLPSCVGSTAVTGSAPHASTSSKSNGGRVHTSEIVYAKLAHA
jgi:hypothetical protein